MSDIALLASIGAPSARQTKFVPLTTSTFFSGLMTQRSPFNTLDSRYNRRFLGARQDALIDGSNCELTNYGTLIRRYGTTSFSNQTLSGSIQSFYAFRQPGNAIDVLVDTSTNVYRLDATSNTNIVTKAMGAGQTYFQSVGNFVYMGDGIDALKWDRVLTALSVPAAPTLGHVSGGSLSGATYFATVTYVTLDGETPASAESSLAMGGNNLLVVTSPATVTGALGYNVYVATTSGAEVQQNAGYVPIGTNWTMPTSGLFASGAVAPVVNTSNQPSVWGLPTPATAPTAVSTQIPVSYPTWAANTFFWPYPVIQDSNSNIQLLTTDGTTGGVQPVWNVTPGGTTNDGSAVWTNKGQAARQNNHAYVVGDVISTTFTTVINVWAGPTVGYITKTYTYTDFFKCTTAGTSSSLAPVFNPGYGSTTVDGTVGWTDIGTNLTWTSIGGTTLVTQKTQILDSNNNLENVIVAGKSGGSTPTWLTTTGAHTIDGGVTWTNQGTPSGGSSTSTLAWIYTYSFGNSRVPHFGTAAPRSSPIILAANSYVTLQGTYSPDPQCDIIRIFRTALGGSTCFFLNDIPNPSSGNWTFNDSSDDSVLNTLIQAPVSHANDAPPVGIGKMCYHLNRIWGVVNNYVYYSGGPDTLVGSGNESWPPANFFQFPTNVNRLLPISSGLLVFTVDATYLIVGTTTATLYPMLYQDGLGLLSYNAIDTLGNTIFLYTSDKQFVAFSSAGINETGFAIGDQLEANYNPSTAYVAALISGTRDKAAFIADGASKWFRCNPNQAPEGGPAWSPQATLANGMTAIAAVETSPGVHQLLVGVPGGNVVYRDLTNFSDTGTPYTAYATVGSLVLAQPGQLALVDSVTLELQKQGTLPTVSVLLDEITGSFETLTNNVNDPPMLSPSTSLYSQRWYLTQGAAPVICRHLQIKVSFVAEAAKNELLTMSVYGALEVKE